MPDTPVLCFCEGTEYYVNEFMELYKNLRKHPAALSSSGVTFKFTISGVLLYNNQLVVIYPKNYAVPDDPEKLKTETITFLRVLLRYRLEKFKEPEEQDLLIGNEENSNGRIVAGVYLVEDYKNHGYLNRKTNIDATSTPGRISWPDTINKKLPYINHGKPVYLTPVVKSSVQDPDNIILRIHQNVIAECAAQWGWLLGLPWEDFHAEPLPVTPQKAIAVMKNELAQTFVQRDINVIKLIIQYLTAKTGTESAFKHELLATPYFYYVWESVCGYIFGNSYQILKNIVPQPLWVGNNLNNSISQRPDIFFTDSKNLYIIDAKYYNYNESLPGWHDVVKQMFYQYTVAQNLKTRKGKTLLPGIEDVINLFVLPDNASQDINYLGYVHFSEIEHLGKVYYFAVNIKSAMQIYGHRKKSHLKHMLIEYVDKVVKEQ